MYTIHSYTYYAINRMEGFKWSSIHFWHLHNVFNLELIGFWVTNAFDTWLAIYVELAADDEICIYCLGVNSDISFLFFSYFFITIHFTNVVLKESLELSLHGKIWKAWKVSFVSEIWIIYL